MSWIDFTLRIAVAFLLGSGIGLERQWRQRMAGLRTNTLVCVGAALFVMLSVMTPGESSPTRMAAQVVSGIGFLAGGVILREGLTVRGLNTAASLWCAAAIGCLAGGGLFFQAFVGAIAVLIANVGLRPIGYRIDRQPLKGKELGDFCYRIQVTCQSKNKMRVQALLLQAISSGKMNLRSLHSEEIEDMPDQTSMEADLITPERNDNYLEELISGFSLDPGVNSVKWKIRHQRAKSLIVKYTA
jgi:putative Mg2+ transporter-C (MgtC) family protein